jgi:glycosyltransferase involved in cell wall biosynthesis
MKAFRNNFEMKISVLLPAYNCEKYITEAVNSILGQTFRDFELIIIDDGSTDDTRKILLDLARKDRRIKLILSRKNKGIVHSMNLAVKKARGKYLARMDADDVSLRTRLEKQYRFLEENRDVFLCGTSYYMKR